MSTQGPRVDGRRHAPVIGVLAALVLVGGILAATLHSDEPRVAAEPTTTTIAPPTTTTTTTTTAPKPQVPVTTVLASPKGDIPTFDAPGGAQVGTTGHWYGFALTLPVIDERPDWSQPGWLNVRLPIRPNGTTAWVRASDVTLSTTPYRIVIDRASTHLTVYQAGFPILWFPVGLGKPSTPTPAGSFFVAVNEGPVPGWGPVVLDLSAHSEAIADWEGSGDAIGAIHGPFGADPVIADTGAYVSNGCIRMHEDQQAQLDFIPTGTPVDIVGEYRA